MGHHKDGLTATCPHFQARKDYRGGHWIQCAMGMRVFVSAWERNLYYKAICCQCGRGGELLDIASARPNGRAEGERSEGLAGRNPRAADSEHAGRQKRRGPKT